MFYIYYILAHPCKCTYVEYVESKVFAKQQKQQKKNKKKTIKQQHILVCWAERINHLNLQRTKTFVYGAEAHM